jgi:predicted Ser/Thr protein kinase
VTPERWAQVKELFQRALDQPATQRHAWLASAAAGDTELLREVDTLLAAHETTGQFLEEPPVLAGAEVEIFPAGTVLGSFEILDELGRGGGGIVYRAQDRRLRREVALKLVAAGANPELRERLRREARAAATISHPSIATIYALEEFDDQLFIVSEYVRGRTLRTILANGPVPRHQAIAIARSVVAAVRAAHEAGVVHRDLKPENVLLSDSGIVKVVDFGIARVADEGVSQLTRHGALLGTPAYMAPEQLLGTTADARTDIFAIGILLIEMITGRHPGLAAAAAPVSGRPEGRPLRTTGDTESKRPEGRPLPTGGDTDALIEVARHCTQLDPAARYQSASALLDVLEQLDGQVDLTRSQARWWWEFHQAAVATVYWLTLWPAWYARSAIGGGLGRAFFIAVLSGVVVSACLRLHLWFTSRFYPAELMWVRRHSRWWITGGDVMLAGGLVSGALLIRSERSSLDVVLLSIGVGVAVAFLVIEAATTRAAFRTDS